jgi:hypothetical protein
MECLLKRLTRRLTNRLWKGSRLETEEEGQKKEQRDRLNFA